MPSIIPSYVYTLFACMIVGTMLICFSSESTANTKQEADKQEMENIAKYVATKSFELVSSAKANNLTTNFMLDIPYTVGYQRYWLQLANDSSTSWVQIGFGIIPQSSGQRMYIPSKILAYGVYISGSGIAVLKCHTNSTSTYLELSGGV